MQNVWNQVLENFRNTDTITESECQRWLIPVVPLSLTDVSFSLGAPNDFSLHYIEEHYIPFIKDAVRAILDKEVEIKIETIPESKKKEDGRAAQPIHESQSSYEERSSQTNLFPTDSSASVAYPHKEVSHFVPIMPGDHSSLKEKYTFENFVTGTSNQLAYSAALAVVKKPGRVYNPLFLYGGVGLGKTHLMHAIGNQILKDDPTKRVLYISSEKFLNDFIASIREGKPREFQQKYRNIDVLLVDDIQFLYTKERTQEEFFHTFNALYDAEKAIILSADRHPRDIKIIEDRLRSRFEWGLPVDITAPDLETRIAILQKKAMLDHLDIPDDVFYFIASRVDSNIRELEGALTRVVAQADLENQSITIDLAGKAMKGSYPIEPTKSITLELIQDITASHFNVQTGELFSKKRTRDLALARQVAMYLCRKLTDSSLPQIGEYFGGRDHTTVMHAYDKITKMREESAQFDKMIGELTDRIRQM